jgi:serine/threonine protein kinase
LTTDTDEFTAFDVESPPAEIVTMLSLRAPEIVLGGSFDCKIDIWAPGCMMFHLVMAEPLFLLRPEWAGMTQDVETSQDEHLLQMAMRLGSLPKIFFGKWPARNDFYAPDGTLVRTDLGPDEKRPSEMYVIPSMEVEIQNLDIPGFDELGKKHVLELLRSMLNYDPAKRPSAAELLEHDWFQHTLRWKARMSKFEKQAEEEKRKIVEEQARLREELKKKRRRPSFGTHAARCCRRANMLEELGWLYSEPYLSLWRRPPLWHAGRWIITLRKGTSSRPKCRSVDGTRECWGGKRRWKVKQNNRMLRCRGDVSMYSDPYWSK